MKKKNIPAIILEDDDLSARFKVHLSDALVNVMDASAWKKFAVLHTLERQIINHGRFLRSCEWSDPDYAGLVLDLVRYLFNEKPDALMEFFERSDVQRWLQSNAPKILDELEGVPDPLIEAITHGLAETAAVRDIIDLSQYTTRIQTALPDDPYQAIGATKDMLEATMRTILHGRGHIDVDQHDFPALTTHCFVELGLIANTAPTTQGERHVRKIASSAKIMIETANALRNLAGTGHGRIVGEEEVVTAVDASLVASSGLVLASWLLRHAKNSK
jgi:hypothetical protein